MRKEVRTAFTAAGAANAAAQAGVSARNLLYCDPTAWAFADQVYWLCKTAAQAAQAAADALDAEWAEEAHGVAIAFADATQAAEEAQAMADELVSLAEEAGHVIRR